MIATIGSFLVCMAVLYSIPLNAQAFFRAASPMLQGIQALLLAIAPLLYSLLGSYWSQTARTTSSIHTHIFLLWYNRWKKFFLLGLYLFVAISCCFSLIPESGHPAFQSLPSVLGWIAIGISLDYLFYTLCAIESHTQPKAYVRILKSEMMRALKIGDMNRVISCYELLFGLVNDCLQESDPLMTQGIEKEVLSAVEAAIESIPKLTLFQAKNNDNETLLDKMAFLEALTAKRMAFLLRNMTHHFEQTGEVQAGHVLFSMGARLFLLFQERYTTLGFVILQTMANIISDSMRKIGTHRSMSYENPMAEFSITLSECIKTLADRSLAVQVSSLSSITRLLSMLESLMKDLFRFDRSINPALLMQPFAEVGQYLGDEKFQKLPDRDVLMAQLKQALSQFAILETLSERLDIQGAKTDTAASYKEDLPFQS